MSQPDEDLNPGDEAPDEAESTGRNVCPACGGSGQTDGDECAVCGGTGEVNEAVGGG